MNTYATVRISDFEEVYSVSDLIGEVIKMGRGNYDYSVIGYGVNDRPDDRAEIACLFAVNGSLMCECDANVTSDVTLFGR